jgi:hypothetical protein
MLTKARVIETPGLALPCKLPAGRAEAARGFRIQPGVAGAEAGSSQRGRGWQR